MIKKILIANRGEIARRIIKTAKNMGISTLALYTNDEKDAIWAKEADESFLLSEGDNNNTYLSPIRILDIAKKYLCDAIHPGYGFLSENWSFAQACQDENITFIGPSADIIKLMGDKNEARNFVRNLEIPIPFGINGSIVEINNNSHQLVFPCIIKAAGGGGGKGMQIVYNADNLAERLKEASNAALKWFGNDQVYIEQYFENARHIEVQILGDKFGNSVHLFERECTLQRNYQKIIEEAPSPTLNHEQRQLITNAALLIAKETKYFSAGTIEFLWQDDCFYFLEMNTRIQVEHPVTEAITGIDIVEQQIHIANNFELKIRQKDINISGHAIECRIYAEKPDNDFKPSAGFMHLNKEPQPIVRIDSSYKGTSEISSKYDGLISKVITHKSNRNDSFVSMIIALQDYNIHGIEHNISYLVELLNTNQFSANKLSTNFIKEQHRDLLAGVETRKHNIDIQYIKAVFLAFNHSMNATTHSVWSIKNENSIVKNYSISIDNKKYNFNALLNGNQITILNNEKEINIDYLKINNNIFKIVIDGNKQTVVISEGANSYWIQIDDLVFKLRSQHLINQAKTNKKYKKHTVGKASDIKSPLYGSITEIKVSKGQSVKQGENLIVIESMKTENQILSTGTGTVKDILVEKGEQIKEEQLLIIFE